MQRLRQKMKVEKSGACYSSKDMKNQIAESQALPPILENLSEHPFLRELERRLGVSGGCLYWSLVAQSNRNQ
jgi:hypothetical protein